MLSRISGFRSLSTSPLTSAIYISTSTSPYFNLSVEDWLFRKAPHQRPLLFLYRNESCVVIGRNQNPWKEINFPALRVLDMPFIRRRSGGGTVYHDLGNTNFSIHLPRLSFNKTRTAQLVQRAVRSLGVDAQLNERNDICVNGFKMTYKIVNNRAYHHGTMLISTELGKLGNLLRNTKDGMLTKGVASVRSPVHNLQQFKSDITHGTFADALVDEFVREYNMNPDIEVINDDSEMQSIEHIQKGISELQQWDWQYGQTPEFTHQLSHRFNWGIMTADIHSQHGIIVSCLFTPSNGEEQAWYAPLEQALVGTKYVSLEGLEEREEWMGVGQKGRQDVIQWLKEEM